MTATPGAPAPPLKVHGSSRLAFGATTAALVTLASGGTAVLVSHATHGVSTPTSLPKGALPSDAVGDQGLVVEHPPGVTPAPAPSAAPAPDPTEQALHNALAARRPPGRRTLTAPLVPLGPVIPPQVVPEVPVPTLPDVDVPGEKDHPVTHPGRPRTATVAVKHGRARGHEAKHAPRHAHPRSHGKGRHAR